MFCLVVDFLHAGTGIRTRDLLGGSAAKTSGDLRIAWKIFELWLHLSFLQDLSSFFSSSLHPFSISTLGPLSG